MEGNYKNSAVDGSENFPRFLSQTDDKLYRYLYTRVQTNFNFPCATERVLNIIRDFTEN